MLDTRGLAGIDTRTNSENLRRDDLIDESAGRVNADFASCHVGETISPAVKEQT